MQTVRIFLSGFNQCVNVSTDYSENPKYEISRKSVRQGSRCSMRTRLTVSFAATSQMRLKVEAPRRITGPLPRSYSLIHTAFRPALERVQHLIQWTPREAGIIKRPCYKADHSRSSSAEVKNTWRNTSILASIFITWCLIKHRQKFTLTLFTQR